MTHDPHLSIGAYVLHALPADERAEFEAHLAGCDSCPQELAGLRETATRLGADTALRAPGDLRARVLAVAARTRQDPPLVAAARSGAPTGPAAADGSGRRAWYQRPVGWLTMAAAVVVVAGGIGWAVLAGRTPELTAGQRMQQCVAADASAARMSPSVGSGGSLLRSDTCSAVTVSLPQLPAPPTGMAYQVWMVKTGERAAAKGMLPAGDATVMAMSMAAGDTAVAVTVEPMTGSKQPTRQPIWVVPLH